MDDHQRRLELLRQFFRDNFATMLKVPKACLRYPFIDPGSIYDGNLWDWDSFWAVYGVFHLLDREPDLKAGWREACVRHAQGNVLNFFDHQLDDGYIPMMIEVKDESVPYLVAKHQGGDILNMHKPFLAQQAALITGWTGDGAWLEPHRDHLERYFACYDRFYRHAATGLYLWADDVMIGMDNDPATFGRPRFSTANIFLNSFLVAEFRAMAHLCASLWGDTPAREAWNQKARDLEGAIRRECWDPRDQFFYSVDIDVRTRGYDWFHQGLGVFWKSLPIKIRAWSGFLPLWSGTAAPREAAALERHITDPQTFWAPHGVTSLAMDEKMYDLRATNNPSNWLGPLWLVVQYVVFRGLMEYGYEADARELAAKTVALLGRDLETSGTLHEYYHPQTGEPVMNGGFLNWNLLVVNMADELAGARPMKSFLTEDRPARPNPEGPGRLPGP